MIIRVDYRLSSSSTLRSTKAARLCLASGRCCVHAMCVCQERRDVCLQIRELHYLGCTIYATCIYKYTNHQYVGERNDFLGVWRLMTDELQLLYFADIYHPLISYLAADETNGCVLVGVDAAISSVPQDIATLTYSEPFSCLLSEEQINVNQ